MKCDIVAVKEVSGFVDDLKEAVGKKIDLSAEFDNVCICGMGASAIGGDIIKDMAADRSSVPISVVRSFDLPHWANKRTMVIVSSYSGNTRETLSMYDHAVERGCGTVAIAAGGKLAEKCRKDGSTLIEVRGGVQPRNALGSILGYMANIVETAGAGSYATEIKRLLPKMRKLAKDIGFDSPDSYAKKIAEKIYGTTPVVFSTSGIPASAMRWKQQINENSKMMSFYGSILEFNHNEIIGWSEGEKFNCVPIVLYEEEASRLTRATAGASIEMLRASGTDPTVVSISGRSVTERSLRAVMIGDHVSVYLAAMNRVDPIDVGPIRSLKEKVSERLDR